MKRKILWLFVLLPSFVTAQTNDAALLKRQKVAQVRIYLGTRLAATDRYDTRGNLIASSEEDFLLESVQRSRIQQFNAQSQVVSLKIKISGDRDTIFWHYHYNERHQLVATTVGYPEKSIELRVYDSTGKLARITQVDPTGQLTSEETFAYNRSGQEVASRRVMAGSREQIKRTTYDQQGRLIREQLFNGDDLFSTQWTAYRPNGQKSKVTCAEPDETTGIAFTYDRHNRLVSRCHFTLEQGPEVTTGTEEFTYTPTGLIKTYAENIFSSSGTKRVFSYEYTYSK
ncbi:hypothetical protein ACFST9_00275 [Hymenobacter monticola]|uniref:RHS repeat protein n=1 Tax=Hymenobacter monticola TaxID=1705399 RepID=A0ABY4BCB4_9BACT|nr:hypothetical protein [Hymenobacter monticola]UOE36802.1 hypothetical protein MTP16_25330 [Hymenobacter monticola]